MNKYKIAFKLKQNMILLLVIVLAALCVISISVGKYYISPFAVLKIMVSKIIPIERDWIDQMETIVWNVRFPRIVGAVIVGAGLSMSAAVLQTMFQNPLVSPFILGISSGAGFGACIAILSGMDRIMMQILIFSGGIIAAGMSCFFAKDSSGRSSKITMVLSGVIVGGFFTSLISAMKYMADPYTKLPEIVFWMMGSLAYVSNESLAWILPVAIVSMTALYILRWKFNILALGEHEAAALGENTGRLRLIGIIFTTLLVSATVSLAGVIGWAGLVVANAARMAAGPDLVRLIPVSALAGAIYLLSIDDIARNIANVEIPLGILTSLVGAPFFIYILKKNE